MKRKDFGMIAYAIFILTSVGLIGITVTVFMVDSFSLEEIRTEDVKCIDKRGNEFNDEYCEDKIYCSWLGLVGDEKCGNSLGDKGQ